MKISVTEGHLILHDVKEVEYSDTIILPEATCTARVTAAHSTSKYKTNDHILIGEYSGCMFEEWRIVKEDEVLAVITDV